MTPQEKAKQLANKYFKQSDLLYEDLTWIQAKECALIAMDEILKAVQNLNRHDTEYIRDEHIPYWEEVKQEIEKL